jgi:hypothetical protein
MKGNKFVRANQKKKEETKKRKKQEERNRDTIITMKE